MREKKLEECVRELKFSGLCELRDFVKAYRKLNEWEKLELYIGVYYSGVYCYVKPLKAIQYCKDYCDFLIYKSDWDDYETLGKHLAEMGVFDRDDREIDWDNFDYEKAAREIAGRYYEPLIREDDDPDTGEVFWYWVR